jgi:hypothetical protein
MRIAVTVVIDMTDQQAADYATANRMPAETGRVYAREVVERVRAGVLADVRAGELGDFADVSLKR